MLVLFLTALVATATAGVYAEDNYECYAEDNVEVECASVVGMTAAQQGAIDCDDYHYTTQPCHCYGTHVTEAGCDRNGGKHGCVYGKDPSQEAATCPIPDSYSRGGCCFGRYKGLKCDTTTSVTGIIICGEPVTVGNGGGGGSIGKLIDSDFVPHCEAKTTDDMQKCSKLDKDACKDLKEEKTESTGEGTCRSGHNATNASGESCTPDGFGDGGCNSQACCENWVNADESKCNWVDGAKNLCTWMASDPKLAADMGDCKATTGDDHTGCEDLPNKILCDKGVGLDVNGEDCKWHEANGAAATSTAIAFVVLAMLMMN